MKPPRTKEFGNFLVIQSIPAPAFICRKPEPGEKANCKYGILVDELLGKGSFKRACEQAEAWDNAQHPSPELLALNERLVALTNKAYGCKSVDDDFYLGWPVARIRKEIVRLERIPMSVEPKIPLTYRQLFARLTSEQLNHLVFISAGCDVEGNVDFEPLRAKGTPVTCRELMSIKGLLDRHVMVIGEIVVVQRIEA